MVAGATHLGQDLVQPLERPVKMDLNPAGGRGHVLSVVLRPPALHKRHTDGAHLGQLVHGLEPVVDGLGQQSGELLVVEDLETATGWYFTHGCWMEAVVVVTVPGLDKDGRVRETFGVDLTSNIVKMNSLANVSPGVLNGRISVNIG